MDYVPPGQFQRTKSELAFVNQWLETFLRYPGMWNGELSLFTNEQPAGTMNFDGSISLSLPLQQKEIRWATHLHEILHSYSKGYLPIPYNARPGWEEGVIEKLQRLLRPIMLEQRLDGKAIATAIEKAQLDATHPYNTYVNALEGLRHLVQEPDEFKFYTQLLRSPLADRAQTLITEVKRVYGANHAVPLRMCVSLNAILNDSTIVELLRGGMR